MKQTITIEFIKAKLFEYGVNVLDTEYINNTTPINCRCHCGTIFKKKWQHFKQRNNFKCKSCGLKSRKQCVPLYSHDKVKELFSLENYELLSQYRVVDDKLSYRCHCGHISHTNLSNFLKGKRCPSCAKRASNNPCWNFDREEVRLNKLFSTRCHTLVKNTLKSLDVKKDTKSINLLGYYGSELRKHIESFKEWPTIKNGIWHIDHIFPIKAFIDYGIKDLKIINCLDNLRPISGTDNLRKSAKYDKSLFEKWITMVSS